MRAYRLVASSSLVDVAIVGYEPSSRRRAGGKRRKVGQRVADLSPAIYIVHGEDRRSVGALR
jgi:hypothetical protein